MLNQGPSLSPDDAIPEITVRAIILSIILTIVLAAANAFLGLKLGMTISASIPAAVISMGVLRFFKKKPSNPRENNIVQTAASVGEALTAGIAFVLPALLLLHYWTDFDYWQTVFISLVGGVLGVLYSIPLRRVLLADPHLKFPEGTAIGNVLKSSAAIGGDCDMSALVKGGVVGAILALLQGGFEIVANTMDYWFRVGSNAAAQTVAGFGFGFSPALMAAGYIVGINVCITIFIGALIGWLIGVPVLGMLYGNVVPAFAHAGSGYFQQLLTAGTNVARTNIVMDIWSHHVRYIGVGTMLVGGLWTLVTLSGQMFRGIRASLAAVKDARTSGGFFAIPRIERDVPINYVIWGLLSMAIFTGFLAYHLLEPSKSIPIAVATDGMLKLVSGIGVIYILIGGFVIASISAYFAGLVGSSNNPVSGLAVSAILILGLILYPFLIPHANLAQDIIKAKEADAAVCIFFVSIIACATAIANDTIQDLKAGHMVGATPWKQQVMLMFGVLLAAFVVPLILQLLFRAYGIGDVLPPRCGNLTLSDASQCGVNVSQMLSAPQASLMAAVAKGVFARDLPWYEIMTGAAIAVIGLIVDEALKPRGYRFPVLALGLGIYLPLSNTTPLLFGGLAAFLVNRYMSKKLKNNELTEDKVHSGHQSGLLLACGLVAGAAVMGVILAIPFVLYSNSDVLRINMMSLMGRYGLDYSQQGYHVIGEFFAVAMTIGLCVWLYRTAVNRANK